MARTAQPAHTTVYTRLVPPALAARPALTSGLLTWSREGAFLLWGTTRPESLLRGNVLHSVRPVSTAVSVLAAPVGSL